MFDFQKLEVYQKALAYNELVQQYVKDNRIDRIYRDQLKRASFSIMLNIAEGTSRFTKGDRRNFYIISRGSTYECQSIMDFLYKMKVIDKGAHQKCTDMLVQISKMLYSMVNQLGLNKIQYS